MKTLTQSKAFSMIELLMVMAVGLLLVIMAVPSLTRLTNKSKVQQAAETVVAAVNMATTLSMQLCRSEAVVVYFGDDGSQMSYPLPTILPKKGRIEIWTAKSCQASVGGAVVTAPYAPVVNQFNYSIPYYTVGFTQPLEPLTTIPFTFPDGVRILTGTLSTTTFHFNHLVPSSPASEIKRHYVAYADGKGYPKQGTDDPDYSYTHILIFDTMTGEHVVINASGGATSKGPVTYGAVGVNNNNNVTLTAIDKPLKTAAGEGPGRVLSKQTVVLVNNNIQASIDY